MNLLIGSLTIGFILSLLALGMYISFRIFSFPDVTVDGSITLGASVAAILLIKGVNPAWATMAAAAAGCIAGAMTGIIHTRFRIHALLSGILVMTALYSVNLRVMGRSNLPLLTVTTIATQAEAVWNRMVGAGETVNAFGWSVMSRDVAVLVFAIVLIAVVCKLLHMFLLTNLGTAMRATGDNPQMIRALGANTDGMIVVGLALSNGLVGISGALMAQYQGFADVQMGIGMVVWGLAAVIIGEALVRSRELSLVIVGVVIGSVLFRLLVAIALRCGLNPNDLKLITAIFVFAALVLPGLVHKVRGRKGVPANA